MSKEAQNSHPASKETQNPNAKIILVDQDGVLADFESEFLSRWQQKYPDLPYIPVSKRRIFFIQDEYPQELRPLVEGIFHSRGFFANLPPIKGGIDAVRELRQQGHIVKICTSPLTGNKDCVQEKHDWVERHLGGEWVRELIISNDKTLIYGDLLIDDKPEIKGAHTPSWEHVIFDAPYNRSVNDARRRLSSWSELQSILPKKVV